MSELKPCPFCGEPVVFNKFAEKVVCEDCGATIYSDYWNTRPIEDALNARIAKLRKALIRIEEEYYSNGTWEETADDMYELANDALLNDKESIVNG